MAAYTYRMCLNIRPVFEQLNSFIEVNGGFVRIYNEYITHYIF